MKGSGDRAHPYHSRLVKAVLWYLREKKGWTVWANDTGRFTGKGTYGTPGTADIVGWAPVSYLSVARGGSMVFARACKLPRFVAVECKVGGDKLRAKQAKFLEEVREAGGIALVVRLPKSKLGSDLEAKLAVREAVEEAEQ